MQTLITKAKTLVEALPYIRRFWGQTIVIKYGGAAMAAQDLRDLFAQDIALMKYVGMKPVIVHGGGPQIKNVLDRLSIQCEMREGMRVTDEATLEVVEMVLGGPVNSGIVQLLNRHGAKAVGLTGKDGSLIEAVKYRGENGKGGVDFGLVGEVERVNPEVVEALLDRFVPVIAPLGVGADGNTYNINADLAAGKIASAMGAAKFIILTDVEGVKDKNGTLLHTLTASQAKRLIEEGVIAGGMIPKVRCCIHALEEGAKQAHIIDGRVEHSVLLEIFTDSGIGTQIIKD